MNQPTGGSGHGPVIAAVSTTGRTASGDAIPVEIIALEGELDLSNVGQLQHAVDEGIDAGASDFTADLSKVGFLDGRSVKALLDGSTRATRRDAWFVLANPPASVWRGSCLIGVS